MTVPVNTNMIKVGGFALLALLTLPARVDAHPFHISTAELEFNPTTNKIEVSLKLHSVDLEQALARHSGNKVDLESTASDAELENYLNGHFYLLSKEQAVRIDQGQAIQPGDMRSRAALVGKELKTAWMWLYFELDPPTANGDYALVNTVLLDIAQGQINTVSIRHLAKRKALRMDIKSPWGEIPRQWLAPAL